MRSRHRPGGDAAPSRPAGTFAPLNGTEARDTPLADRLAVSLPDVTGRGLAAGSGLLRQPGLFEMLLVGLVHLVAHDGRLHVAEQLSPEGLHDDAGILEDALQVLHQHAALVGVGNRVGLAQFRVEVRIGEGAFVPGAAGLVGERQQFGCRAAGRSSWWWRRDIWSSRSRRWIPDGWCASP